MCYWRGLRIAAFLLAVAGWGQTKETGDIYRLQPGDGIEIKFYFNPELNDTALIRPDGRIALPLIGEVVAGGRTVADVSRELEQRFAPELKNPKVSIAVRTFSSQRVFVGGEVNRAGTVTIAGNLTVLDAIMDAGGSRRTGDLSRVVLIRKSKSDAPERHVLRLNGEKSALAQRSDIGMRVQPFDLILVPETKTARMDRWVDQTIRQMIPANLSAGFSYLFNPLVVQ